MGYYHGEKSLGLGPILIALSLVAVMSFALLYYSCGRTIDTNTPTTPSAGSLPAPVPAGETGTSAPPVQPTKMHNHV